MKVNRMEESQLSKKLRELEEGNHTTSLHYKHLRRRYKVLTGVIPSDKFEMPKNTPRRGDGYSMWDVFGR